MVWSAVWITVALAVRAVTGDRRPALALARKVWSPGLIYGAGARLEIEGGENAGLDPACFFVANHQSWIDVPALFVAIPRPLLFLGKKELARVPFLGWYMGAMGMVFVERGERLQTGRSVNEAAERLRQGWSLLSFPEGGRSRDGRVQRFKGASFAAAIDAGAPVVPVAIRGAAAVLPRDGFRVRPGRIQVAIGEPIPTAGLTRADRADLALRTQREVEHLLAGLSGEGSRAEAWQATG